MPTAVVEVADWVVVPVGRRLRHEDLTVAETTMGLIKIPQAARCRLRLEAGIKEKQAGKPIRKGPMLPRFPTALSRRGSPTIEVLRKRRNENGRCWTIVRHISFDPQAIPKAKFRTRLLSALWSQSCTHRLDVRPVFLRWTFPALPDGREREQLALVFADPEFTPYPSIAEALLNLLALRSRRSRASTYDNARHRRSSAIHLDAS